MWMLKKGVKNKMFSRYRKFFVITDLTIVLMIVFGGAMIGMVSGSSVSEYKKASRVHSRGINDVLDSRQSHPREYDDYEEYSEELGHGHTDKLSRDEIEEYSSTSEEHDHENQGPPSIAKCCAIGEALNAEGHCQKLDPNYNHDKTWHPSVVYYVETESWVPVNMSQWQIMSPFNIQCPENTAPEVVSDLGKFVMIADGGLFLSDQRRHIDALEFCFDQQLGKHAGRAIISCFTKENLRGKNTQVLRKCCPHDTMVQLMDKKLACFLPENREEIKHIPGNWTIDHGPPACQYGENIIPISPNDTIKLTDDGALVTSSIQVPFLNYCLDYFQGKEENPKLQILMCLNHDEGKAVVPHTLIEMPTGVSVIYGIALIVSSICLALAALISLRLPELRSLHGKCQLSHLATLFSFFVLLAATHLGADKIPQTLCTFFAVAIHFCALSSFLWLNLLCVNIYLTFRSLRPPLAARRGETRRLFFLCVYAWGIPAAFCLFLLVLDTPGRLEPMPQPGYGQLKCLISNREAEFAYLFGPVGLLLLLNGILFCLTAQELLCGLWRLDNSDSINFRRKSMGIVVAKLGIVMGMGWILDVTSWVAGPGYPYLFYAADLFNSLQGLFIFIVLICRKRVLEVLHLRKPSITKDDTLTGRPFLQHKHSTLSQTITNVDQDTSLISAQDA